MVNSEGLLQQFVPEHCAALMRLLRSQFENDVFEQSRQYAGLVEALSGNAAQWETLFTVFVTHNASENPGIRNILATLMRARVQMLAFGRKLHRHYTLVFSKLPADHALFKHHRYLLFELHGLFAYARKQEPAPQDAELGGVLLQMLEEMYSTTRHLPDLPLVDQVFIVRCYAEAFEWARPGQYSELLAIVQEDFKCERSTSDESAFAFTHYRVAQVTLRDPAANPNKAMEHLRKSEQLFTQRLASPATTTYDKYHRPS